MLNEKRDSSGDDFNLNNTNGYLSASSSDSPVVQSRKTSSAPNSNRVWSNDDEIVILKGIIDYRNKTGLEYYSDSTAFFDHIKRAIDAKVSKDQLMRKIGKLKAQFKDNLRKKRRFINSRDFAKFDMCKTIWGKNEGSNINETTGSKSKVEAFVEHGDGEPEIDDESEASTKGKLKIDHASAKGVSCGKLPSENVNKGMKKENEEDSAEHEILNLQDALESTVFQGLSISSQKHMLKKLKTLNPRKRKDLNNEWMSLLLMKNQLKIKRYRFAAKLGEATL